MGIDAEMLLRLTGPKPTEAQLTEWSWNLCRSVGAEHFFTRDGMPPPEHHKAEKAWHHAFNTHPLYAEWRLADKAHDYEKREKLHDGIFASIGRCPESRQRAIELTNYVYPLDADDGYDDVPPEYRIPGRAWTQDGDSILAPDGEWFCKVNLWTRYYGVGYERGNLLVICATAEWCELNLPNCVVWYGGDSSGVEAAPFPHEERLKLKKHLYSQQGRDYFRYDARQGRKPNGPAPCGLCIPGGDFQQYGSGPNYAAVHCAGCGKNFESSDGGKTWAEKEKEAA